MSRTVLAISLALIVFLPACQGESGELPSDPEEVTAAGKGPCPTEINDMIAGLFPRGLGSAAHHQCGNIARKLGRGDLDNAIGKTFNLIEFAVKHYEKGRLEDPPGPQTTEEGLTELLNALLVWVGLDPSFAGDFDFEICKPNRKCVFETGTQFAGISATFTEQTLVTIARLPDDPGPFETFGFDDFPLFFDFSATSISGAKGGPSFGLNLASAPLAEPATVAVCVVDPPDPMAPDPDILPNIALGHVIQGEEGPGVEILEEAPPGDFALDCTGASTSGTPEVDIVSLRWWGERAASAFGPVSEFMVAPLLANPGERRGLITAFSPVGAVDTTSAGDDDDGGPTRTTLTLNEQASNLSISHGQIATATAIVDPAPGNELEPSVTFVFSQFSGGPGPPTVTQFLDDGKASVIVQCDTQGTLPPPEGGVEISTTRFARAEFPGAGDGAFEASDSNTLILGCSSAPSPE
ncbi:MAG: hypothetical protein ACREK3_08775 [Gemmatimonadota bacterium]